MVSFPRDILRINTKVYFLSNELILVFVTDCFLIRSIFFISEYFIEDWLLYMTHRQSKVSWNCFCYI